MYQPGSATSVHTRSTGASMVMSRSMRSSSSVMIASFDGNATPGLHLLAHDATPWLQSIVQFSSPTPGVSRRELHMCSNVSFEHMCDTGSVEEVPEWDG